MANLACENQYKFINFISLYFCRLNQQYWVIIILAILIIYISFNFLNALNEQYIMPGMSKISQLLNLNEAIASVTLLSLGLGSSEIVLSAVAAHSSEGMLFNFGLLFTSGLITFTAVMALCIKYNNNHINMSEFRNNVYRDMAFFALTCVLFVCFGFHGKLSILSGVLLLVLFLVYVMVVAIQDNLEKRHKMQCLQKSNLDSENNNDKEEEEESGSSKLWSDMKSDIASDKYASMQSIQESIMEEHSGESEVADKKNKEDAK